MDSIFYELCVIFLFIIVGVKTLCNLENFLLFEALSFIDKPKFICIVETWDFGTNFDIVALFYFIWNVLVLYVIKVVDLILIFSL